MEFDNDLQIRQKFFQTYEIRVIKTNNHYKVNKGEKFEDSNQISTETDMMMLWIFLTNAFN